MLSHAELLELVHYDPETGIFTLRRDAPRRAAGTVLNNDRIIKRRRRSVKRRITSIYVCSDCNVFLAGRLAWFYMTGEWPAIEVDHADNDGRNQRWLNLRLATRSQNQANTRLYKSNLSGKKGVFRNGSEAKPWRAQIQKDGKKISLGYFETVEAASQAFAAAAAVQHGEFARLA